MSFVPKYRVVVKGIEDFLVSIVFSFIYEHVIQTINMLHSQLNLK